MFFKRENRNAFGRRAGEDRRVVLRGLRIFIVLLLAVGALLALGGTVIYHIENKEFITEFGAVERNALVLQDAAVGRELDHLVADILFLSRQNELIRLLDSGDSRAAQAMEREYLELASSREDYDRLRYLDSEGMERVRVDGRDGRTRVVPEGDLLDKGDRYYFKECFALDKGGLYLSPMSPSVEDGRMERPVRPTLRVGTPVFDSTGSKRGIVLINYNARPLLDRVLRSGGSADGLTMLLNRRGYWLLAPDESREWGFMAPETRDVSFATEMPGEWERMLAEGSGQFRTDNGLFTFATVHPLAAMREFSRSLHASAAPVAEETGPSPYFWMLVSQVTTDTLARHASALLVKLFIGGGALFLLIGFGAWHLAQAVSRRQLYQEQLVAAAMFDALTTLPNRKLFYDRLEASLALSSRYERRLALLYIDLDGFKAVNDSLGHGAGDELLKRVGALLTGSVRKSDTVARLGGDEFVVMLNEVTNVGDAALVGEKLVSTLRAPILLKGGSATIGASVGVAVYPEHGESAEDLVRKADQAMYASKAKGRNTCTMADSSRCAA